MYQKYFRYILKTTLYDNLILVEQCNELFILLTIHKDSRLFIHGD
jgi:hypothetical protein